MRWRIALGSQSLLAQSVWAGARIMVGYRAINEQAEPWLLVLLTAVFAAPALLAAYPAGRVTDRWGGTGMAAAGSIVCATGLGLVIALPGLGWLLAASSVIGLGNLLLMVGQQTFVVHMARKGPTEGAFGFLSACASAGQALGPLIVTTAATVTTTASDSPSTTLGLAVCLVLCVICIPMFLPMRTAERTWSRSARPLAEPHSKLEPIPLDKVWPALAVSAIILVTMDMLYTFVPAWGQEHDVSASAVGLLLSLRALVSMISRFGLASLVRRIGLRSLLAASTALTSVALILFPHSGLPGAFALMVLLGIGLGVPQPLTMAWSVALTDPRLHGAVLGLRLTANRLGQLALPALIGIVAAPLGSAAVFYANALLSAGAASLSWWRADPRDNTQQ